MIAATNRNLRDEAAAGRFRSDLFYRLGIIKIFLQPLRKRREDIPYLGATFIRACASRLNKQVSGMTPSAERFLQQAPWPGNICVEKGWAVADEYIFEDDGTGGAAALRNIASGSVSYWTIGS